MNQPRTRLRAAALIAAACLTLAACGSDTDGSTPDNDNSSSRVVVTTEGSATVHVPPQAYNRTWPVVQTWCEGTTLYVVSEVVVKYEKAAGGSAQVVKDGCKDGEPVE